MSRPKSRVLLLANKSDSSRQDRQVSSEEGQALAQYLRVPFIEVSAVGKFQTAPDVLIRKLMTAPSKPRWRRFNAQLHDEWRAKMALSSEALVSDSKSPESDETAYPKSVALRSSSYMGGPRDTGGNGNGKAPGSVCIVVAGPGAPKSVVWGRVPLQASGPALWTPPVVVTTPRSSQRSPMLYAQPTRASPVPAARAVPGLVGSRGTVQPNVRLVTPGRREDIRSTFLRQCSGHRQGPACSGVVHFQPTVRARRGVEAAATGSSQHGSQTRSAMPVATTFRNADHVGNTIRSCGGCFQGAAHKYISAAPTGALRSPQFGSLARSSPTSSVAAPVKSASGLQRRMVASPVRGLVRAVVAPAPPVVIAEPTKLLVVRSHSQ